MIDDIEVIETVQKQYKNRNFSIINNCENKDSFIGHESWPNSICEKLF